MSLFEGWFIKFGNVILPNSYMYTDGYESTPNQREQLKAYRDGNRLLHLETSPNHKTTIKMNIRELWTDEKEAFQNVIKAAYLNERQRKIAVTYWNDEDNVYKYGEFYYPDITFSVHQIDEVKKQAQYNSFEIELIEF